MKYYIGICTTRAGITTSRYVVCHTRCNATQIATALVQCYNEINKIKELILPGDFQYNISDKKAHIERPSNLCKELKTIVGKKIETAYVNIDYVFLFDEGEWRITSTKPMRVKQFLCWGL